MKQHEYKLLMKTFFTNNNRSFLMKEAFRVPLVLWLDKIK